MRFEDPLTLDLNFRNDILLTEENVKLKSSYEINESMVQRFARVSALFNYHKFFPILLKQAIVTLTTQNILVVELKHIAGRLFDDD